MNTSSEIAQKAYNFSVQLKNEIMRQINHFNGIADGELQDGFNPTYLEDGWVMLKGCSWGFVVHYDDPVRMDMTFGPDQPFVGYRTTFVISANGDRLSFTNKERSGEVLFGVDQVARYGLRRLASKVGDQWLFDTPAADLLSQESTADAFIAESH